MNRLKIDDLSVLEILNDEGDRNCLNNVMGGEATIVSCNADGTYTYKDGDRTWTEPANDKPWWRVNWLPF
jgi:hypothetical protein